MVRVISQETFDDVVKENMEEFGLSREEAIKDAIEQFESQGVSLANIVTSAANENGGEHVVVASLKALKTCKDLPENEAVEMCSKVSDECSKGLAEKMLATQHDGYSILIDAALNDSRPSVFLQTVKALGALLHGNPDPFDERCFGVILQSLESESSPETIHAGLELTLAVCVRHEQNRQNLMRNKILDLTDKAYQNHPEEVARIWQALVQDDDVRVPYGKAHENARQIVEEHDAQTKLVNSLKGSSDPSSFLSCLSSLTVRNEYCQSLADHDGLSCLFGLLADPEAKTTVMKEALLLFKTMAGNDNIKRDIGSSGKIPLIVSIMSNNMANKGICQAGSALLTAICLRMPNNAQDVVTAGGDEVLVQVLQTHMAHANVAVSLFAHFSEAVHISLFHSNCCSAARA